MMKTRASRMTVAALGLLLLGLPACGKKNLDKAVDKLVNAAVKNDYDAFKAMSHSALVDKFPAEKFKLLSESLKLLGKYTDRTMKGIHAKTGKRRKGRYKLAFEKGTVFLEITLVRGKLTGFLFTGDAIEEAMKQVKNRAFGTFKVGGFKYLDAAGKDHNNVYKAGEKVRFSVAIFGMQRKNKQLKLLAGLRVVDAQGKVLLQKPRFVDQALPLKDGEPPVATATGTVTLPNPGHYKLQLKLTDVFAGKTLDYSSALLVEKK